MEEIPLEKHALEFLYADGDHCCFMNPETFEQTEIPLSIAGPQAVFLDPGMRVPVEFMGSRPIRIVYPVAVEVRIADTAPPIHQQVDSNLKPAKLENGTEVMVPKFVKSGDVIRLDFETMKYMDRVRAK